MTELKKEICKRLIELDKSQKWLCEEVAKMTGQFFDDSYFSKLMRGERKTQKMLDAIEKALRREERRQCRTSKKTKTS